MTRSNRRRRAQRAAPFLALLIFGCSAAEPDFGGPLSPRDFTLGGEAFTIALPEQAKIAVDPGGAFLWIELRPDARSSPSIWLETPYDLGQPFELVERARWREDLALDYRTALSEGGSGGEEATLDGRLEVGARRWTAACRAQAEPPAPLSPGWCLPLLATIQPKPEGPAPE